MHRYTAVETEHDSTRLFDVLPHLFKQRLCILVLGVCAFFKLFLRDIDRK